MTNFTDTFNYIAYAKAVRNTRITFEKTRYNLPSRIEKEFPEDEVISTVKKFLTKMAQIPLHHHVVKTHPDDCMVDGYATFNGNNATIHANIPEKFDITEIKFRLKIDFDMSKDDEKMVVVKPVFYVIKDKEANA